MLISESIFFGLSVWTREKQHQVVEIFSLHFISQYNGSTYLFYWFCYSRPMTNTSTNVGVTAHKKVFEEPDLLNTQPYFPQRKKMTETWSPAGRSGYCLTTWLSFCYSVEQSIIFKASWNLQYYDHWGLSPQLKSLGE